MKSAFVVMVENDDHDTELDVFDIESDALYFAENKTSCWCEDGYTHEVESDLHRFLSINDDDSFSAKVFKRDIK